jgi:hypothetical protein
MRAFLATAFFFFWLASTSLLSQTPPAQTLRLDWHLDPIHEASAATSFSGQ